MSLPIRISDLDHMRGNQSPNRDRDRLFRHILSLSHETHERMAAKERRLRLMVVHDVALIARRGVLRKSISQAREKTKSPWQDWPG